MRLHQTILLATCCVALHAASRAAEDDQRHKNGHAQQDSTSSHEHHHGHEEHDMDHTGMYGSYPAAREASGTSWQPEATPMSGLHFKKGEWAFMVHGSAALVYDNQGGRRGDEDFFSANMVMFMAQHPLQEGTFAFRSMWSLEPATIGKDGYSLLLQTGETGDGSTPLIDRQHPHDLFMELALTYSHPVTAESSVFAYFGMPGEPALGPPAFMHRFSGMDNPEAPITHHYLDSTHITWGVATLGYVWRQFKIDGSIFTGREPDQHRWDMEEPRFDSYSARLSWNPDPVWSFQASYGSIHSPEQLEPDTDVQRITVSANYHRKWEQSHWQTTLAWGQNRNDPGRNLDAVMLESALNFLEVHTVFGRVEVVEKDELFPPGDPQEGQRFTVGKATLGYIYDFTRWGDVRFGVGGLGSVHVLPDSLGPAYGDTPLSFMVFVRAKL